MAKRNLVIFYLLVIFITLFAFGCAQTQSLNGQSSGDGKSFFPHNEGYTWRYSNNAGYVTFSTFEGTKVLNSKNTQIYKSCMIGSSGDITTAESYYLIDDSGFYQYPPEPLASYNIYLTWLSFPLEVNKSWDVLRGGSVVTTAKILAKETVVTSAGSFECYKVNYLSTSGTEERDNYNVWYGNNVGIVKTNSNLSTFESYLEWKNF